MEAHAAQVGKVKSSLFAQGNPISHRLTSKGALRKKRLRDKILFFHLIEMFVIAGLAV